MHHRLLSDDSHSSLVEHVSNGGISAEDGLVVSSVDREETRLPDDVDDLAKLHLRAIFDMVRFRSP